MTKSCSSQKKRELCCVVLQGLRTRSFTRTVFFVLEAQPSGSDEPNAPKQRVKRDEDILTVNDQKDKGDIQAVAVVDLDEDIVTQEGTYVKLISD